MLVLGIANVLTLLGRVLSPVKQLSNGYFHPPIIYQSELTQKQILEWQVLLNSLVEARIESWTSQSSPHYVND